MTNKCINCGCEDAYPSLPAFPSPDPCANPQPCAEVFDAQCVSYTLPNILCGDDIVIAQDSTIAAALESVVLFMCSNITSLQECCDTNTLAIANLNLEVSEILSQLGGLITGSGTLNYLARWTPDGTTLGNSIIRDNGTSLGIGIIPNNITILDIDTTLQGPFITSTKINTAGSQSAYGTIATSSGINSLGDNIGVAGFANGNSNRAIGVLGNAINIGNTNIGGYFTADNGVSNYSVQLRDNTEGIGKVLTCVTADGKANWVTPSGGGVAGSGTPDYVARWTPDGATLGIGVIRDNSTSVGIGVAPSATASLYISSSVFGIISSTNSPGYSGGDFRSTGITPTSANIGVRGQAYGSDAINIGAEFKANVTAATDNIGIRVYADNAINNYALQLSDGSEAPGRFLKCITANGQANWATLPTSGIVWNTVTGVNPIVNIVPDNGYLLKNTSGTVTILNLPTTGVSIGDEIRVMAPNLPTSLSNWEIRGGNADDRIYYSFYNDVVDAEQNGILTPGISLLLIRFDNVFTPGNNYTYYKYQNLTLTCIDILGTGYAWNIEIKNNKKIG
jgi:hypothetical protein